MTKKLKIVLIALFLAIIMVFGVAGCNASSQNDLQSTIDNLQSQIAEMEDQIRERDKKIEQLENEIAEMQDYILKISADKQVYSVNEEIFIDVALENRSGEDVEIAYYFLFIPESPTGEFPAYELPPVTTKKIFENGEIIFRTERLGGCFPIGQHELKYKAIFYLAWEMTEFGYETTSSDVIVWSNTIEFSVAE